MFKNLLVPIDGSAPSNAAITLAVAFAKDQGARVIFTHATEPLLDEYAAWEGTVALAPAGEQVATKQMLEQAVSVATQAGVAAVAEILHGEVVDSVLTFARERGADLIVMGSHGRSGIARALVGSKTEGVMRHSRVPVLVAPRP